MKSKSNPFWFFLCYRRNILFHCVLFIGFFLNQYKISAQLPEPSTAQGKSKSVRIQTGLNQMNEQILLPLVHKGTMIKVSCDLENTGKSLNETQISVIYSRIKTSLEDISKSGNIKLDFIYARNYLIFQSNNLKYYFGPQISLCYSFMIYPDWDESHFYWADYLGAGASNIVTFGLKNGDEWFTSLKIPVFSLYSRPDDYRLYKMDDSSPTGVIRALHSGIGAGSWNRVFQLNLNSEYRFTVLQNKRNARKYSIDFIRKSRTEAFTYSFDFIRISKKGEQALIQITNQLGLKFMF